MYSTKLGYGDIFLLVYCVHGTVLGAFSTLSHDTMANYTHRVGMV